MSGNYECKACEGPTQFPWMLHPPYCDVYKAGAAEQDALYDSDATVDYICYACEELNRGDPVESAHHNDCEYEENHPFVLMTRDCMRMETSDWAVNVLHSGPGDYIDGQLLIRYCPACTHAIETRQDDPPEHDPDCLHTLMQLGARPAVKRNVESTEF